MYYCPRFIKYLCTLVLYVIVSFPYGKVLLISPFLIDPTKQFAEVSPHFLKACDPITKVNTGHILSISNFLQITDRYDNHKYILLKACLSFGMSWLFS